MLLSLLPLAGWAVDDISDKVDVAVGDVVYGTSTAPSIRVTMDGGEISDTYWDIDGYFTKNDGTGEAVALATLPAGAKRYVRIKFKGVYTGTAYGEFEVAKAEIKVFVKTDAYFTKVYKSTAADPAIAASDVSATLRGDDIDAGDLDDYITINETKLKAYTYTGTDVNAEGYPITFDGITLVDADNYELTYDARKMKITPAEITTGAGSKFTFVLVEGSYDPTEKFTYTAAAQRPSYQIAWDHDGSGTTPVIALNEGKDFTVKFNDGTSDVENAINAATYTVKVSGKGNYSGTVEVSDFAFQIKKAPLTIVPIAQTKVYDGTAINGGTAKFSITGRVGADAEKTVTGLAVSSSPSLAANVNDYTITPVTTSAQIGGADLGKNYNIETGSVKWTITARPVTITVADVNMAKGETFPTLASVAATNVELTEEGGKTGAISSDDQGKIAADYELAWANGTGEPLKDVTDGPTGNIKIQDYAEAIKAVLKSTTSYDDVRANYDITVKKGTLKVSGAAFEIMPTVSDVEYSDEYTIGYYANGATIDESKLVFVINETEYPYAAKIANLPTARGSYTVTIKENTAVGTGNYANGTPTLKSTSYAITKKQLTLTVKDLKVHKNDPVTALVALTENGKGVTEKIGDDVVLEYSLDEDVVKIVDGKITGYQAGKSKADASISVALADDVASNENYVINSITKGKLDIVEALSADLAAADAENTIAVAAANGGNYNVTISGRKLNANKWNVMVLPFAVKPLDFCNAIGQYAVFNTLSKVEKDETDVLKDKIYFKLELDEIPANTPFLVKPLDEVDFDIDEDEDDAKDIVFTGVKFEDAGMQPVYDKVAGATFTGNYAASYEIPSTNFWAMQGGQFNHFSEAMPLGFTRAYIELTSGAESARFFIEEPNGNGSTTAIKELSADGIEGLKAAEGWYTLGGVKLQGAPTQKGVYIKDGKKFVIK